MFVAHTYWIDITCLHQDRQMGVPISSCMDVFDGIILIYSQWEHMKGLRCILRINILACSQLIATDIHILSGNSCLSFLWCTLPPVSFCIVSLKCVRIICSAFASAFLANHKHESFYVVVAAYMPLRMYFSSLVCIPIHAKMILHDLFGYRWCIHVPLLMFATLVFAHMRCSIAAYMTTTPDNLGHTCVIHASSPRHTCVTHASDPPNTRMVAAS